MTDLLCFIFLIGGLLSLPVKIIKNNILLLLVQSLALSAIAFYLGYLDKGLHLHIVLIGVLILLVKVIILPWVLYSLSVRLNVEKENHMSFGPVLSLFTGVVMVGLAYGYGVPLLLEVVQVNINLLAAAISTMFFGCFYMISRRCVLNQVIGVIMIENGLFLSALAITGGMPLMIELGIFFDLLVGVLVMGAISLRISQNFQSLDTNDLNRLRG